MPELPEVETVRSGLAAELIGQRLLQVELYRADLRWPMPVDAVQALRGRRCTAVERRAKYLLVRLDGDSRPVLLVHLGMSGRLFVEPSARRRPALQKHEHWRMRFGNRLLRFVDPRRFGALDVTPGAAVDHHPLLRHLGPEPLAPSFDGSALHAATRRRTAAIKTLLMDARMVVGVGNIYACEALFRAGIRPRRAAGRLTKPQCTRLAQCVRETLTDAIAKGGTSLRDYISADGEPGWFQLDLAVYGREGQPCPRCGANVRRQVDGGRSTFFCPACQR